LLDQPGIPAQIEKGEFGELLAWQRNNIYRFGRKLLPEELVQRATGKPLNAEPYLNYLRSKYSQI
jgi:carboxypeptidase Taq